MIALLSGILTGCCAVPAFNLYATGDVGGALMATFLAFGNLTVGAIGVAEARR